MALFLSLVMNTLYWTSSEAVFSAILWRFVEPSAGVHLPEIIGDHEQCVIIRAGYLIQDFLGD